jgi:spore coat protein A
MNTAPKFVTPLVIPPRMPATGANTYDIAVREFQQPILPAPQFEPTRVWSYGSTFHAGTFNYPAFTIETKRNVPIEVTWRNELAPAGPHLFAVDPYLHWANPNGRTSWPRWIGGALL